MKLNCIQKDDESFVCYPSIAVSWEQSFHIIVCGTLFQFIFLWKIIFLFICTIFKVKFDDTFNIVDMLLQEIRRKLLQAFSTGPNAKKKKKNDSYTRGNFAVESLENFFLSSSNIVVSKSWNLGKFEGGVWVIMFALLLVSVLEAIFAFDVFGCQFFSTLL